MSVFNADKSERVEFSRDSCASGWLEEIRETWGEDDPQKLKALVAITLHHQCNWPLHQIGLALGFSEASAKQNCGNLITRTVCRLQAEYPALCA